MLCILQGITADDGSDGGATVLGYDASRNVFAATPFALPDGSTFTASAHQHLTLVFVSSTIGKGNIADYFVVAGSSVVD
jgi:hypothetical protein